jgi:hypothetical protein
LTLKNEKGEDIQVADLANEKGVVLFLVPKADTGTSLVFLVFYTIFVDARSRLEYSWMHDASMWIQRCSP